MNGILPRLLPVLLLIGSNLFMTTAWYGHLRFRDRPLWIVVLVSWGIAFFEYWLAVPANRIGSTVYSAAQLKASPGGRHADDLRGVRGPLPGTEDQLQSCDRIRADRGRGVLRVSFAGSRGLRKRAPTGRLRREAD